MDSQEQSKLLYRLIFNPTPLRHVEEEELEKDLKEAIHFFTTEPKWTNGEVFSQVVSINTFAEVDPRAGGDKGLILTMRDGSRFELTLMRVRGPEHEFEDEIP